KILEKMGRLREAQPGSPYPQIQGWAEKKKTGTRSFYPLLLKYSSVKAALASMISSNKTIDDPVCDTNNSYSYWDSRANKIFQKRPRRLCCFIALYSLVLTQLSLIRLYPIVDVFILHTLVNLIFSLNLL